MEPFSEHLRRVADPIWRAQHEHPFVQGIGDGTLDHDRFKHWMRQDYLFLIEYCRVFAYAAARAPDLEAIRRFGDLLHSTASTEMDLHRAYALELGIPSEELEAETMSGATREYANFLLQAAATAEFPVVVASLLPCMWAFAEIGQALARLPGALDGRYAAWIRIYSDAEFVALSDWCRDLVDRLAAVADNETRSRMEEAFLASSGHELEFWDMAWRLA